ncbi:4459_t:CDS:2, partial [Funneliformis geosporum]
VKIRVNEKGWVNEEKMLWWIENVWCNRGDTNNNLRIIPRGLTGRLQPLDVPINNMYKE